MSKTAIVERCGSLQTTKSRKQLAAYGDRLGDDVF